MHIRPYRTPDAAGTLRVFERAIRETALSHYTAAQVEAWLGAPRDLDAWGAERARVHTYVAEAEPPESDVIGFADLDDGGYVDRLFVSPDAARRGVAAALLGRVAEEARLRGIRRLSTHASLVARPVFERAGFVVVGPETVARGGEQLARFRMERAL